MRLSKDNCHLRKIVQASQMANGLELNYHVTNYGQLADEPTPRCQLADVENQVETSASWSSIQYNLLEVKHTEN